MKAQPKKGGGGHYNWGVATDTREHNASKEDPNYESPGEEEAAIYYQVSKTISIPPSSERPVPQPKRIRKASTGLLDIVESDYWSFDQEALKQQTRKIIDEALLTESLTLAINYVKKLPPKCHSFVVKRILQFLIENPQEEKQELLQNLVELLVSSKIISQLCLRRAFDRIYYDLHEIVTDNPKAPELIVDLLHDIIQRGLLPPHSIVRIPVQFLKVAKGDFILKDIVDNQNICVVDLIEQLQNFKKSFLQVLSNAFDSQNVELISEFHQQVVHNYFNDIIIRKIIEFAFERNIKEKDFCCRILQYLSSQNYTNSVQIEDFYVAFDDLLWSSDVLSVDIPDLANQLSKMLSRSIADEVIPPAYIQTCEVLNQDSVAVKVLDQTQNYLSSAQGLIQISQFWKAGQSLEDLKEQVKNLLREYFQLKDINEIVLAVNEGRIQSSFMHEVVYRSFTLAIDLVIFNSERL